MNIIEPLKKLPKGYYRLIIVGWIVIPLSLAFAIASVGPSDNGVTFFSSWISGIVAYYIITRIFIWIYEGFKN